MNLGLHGLSAIVLGGSKGIGLSCALQLAEEGAAVTLVGRTQPSLDRASTVLKEAGLPAARDLIAADMGTAEGCERLCDLKPDYDIAILVAPRAAEIAADKIELGALAPALLQAGHAMTAIMAHFVTGMRNRKFGRIVNVLGTSVKAPVQAHIVSNIARSGHAAATSTLARTVAAEGVTLNTVLVGSTATETLKRNWERRATEAGMAFDEYSRRQLAGVPLGRLGRPEEAAALCVFLCSKDAAFITAQCIVADGGAVPTIF